jgi:hypothetical protein
MMWKEKVEERKGNGRLMVQIAGDSKIPRREIDGYSWWSVGGDFGASAHTYPIHVPPGSRGEERKKSWFIAKHSR